MRKIPTLFVRDFDRDNGRYVTREVTPGCEWVLAGEGVATRKIDGTCVMFDGERWWARREVKRGKPLPPIYLPLSTDEVTGKTVGWEPIEQSSFAKFHAEALAARAASGAGEFTPGTYELAGPKINGNPEGTDVHLLWPHGETTLPDGSYGTGPRTYDALVAHFAEWTEHEGIVFWREHGNPDAGMVKIKRRDFRPVSHA